MAGLADGDVLPARAEACHKKTSARQGSPLVRAVPP